MNHNLSRDEATKGTDTASPVTPAPQMFGNRQVRIVKSKSTGQRAAEITPFGRAALRFYVPVEMLSLAAGKDEWMKDIQFKCADCGVKHPAREMECEMCPTCFEKAGEENAALDT